MDLREYDVTITVRVTADSEADALVKAGQGIGNNTLAREINVRPCGPEVFQD